MTMNEELLRRLRLCPTLPSPPATAIKVIELVNDPSVSLTQIADCVAHDPALAAKMLKVANSPLYNRRRSATNVRQAVNLMGTHGAITIALSFSLAHAACHGAPAEEEARFWQRSLCAALACRILAQRFQLNPDDLLLAGLIQDIGILALCTAMGERYAKLAMAAANHDELLRAERAEFGSGHDEVGYWLLKRWNLPDYLALACLTSHSQAAGDQGSLFNACVSVSGYLADVFIKRGDAVSILRASNAAMKWLSLDAAATSAIIQEMMSGLAEIEELFELSVLEAGEAEALAVEAKELLMVANLGRFRELEEQSQRDALTGVHNRSYFDRVFAEEFDSATRHGWPLSVAFIDIDYFKRINDMHGHAVGDNTLMSLARLISMQIRNGDVFARYGGEEFVLLLPGTPAGVAAEVLSRIKETVAAISHPLSENEAFNLTISVGIASHMDDQCAHASTDELLRHADNALYAAKQQGRNLVRIADPQQKIFDAPDRRA